MAKEKSVNGPPKHSMQPLSRISVEGFKSINKERAIEFRPLTILAGANSSGKSSMIQPLLLLKQTLEAPYDPGPLLINGPNVRFTKLSQFLCKPRIDKGNISFSFGLGIGDQDCKIRFLPGRDSPVELESFEIVDERGNPGRIIREGTYELSELPIRQFMGSLQIGKGQKNSLLRSGRVHVARNRCLVDIVVRDDHAIDDFISTISYSVTLPPYAQTISHLIHVPALRGNPQRNYPLASVGIHYPGSFDEYVASVIANQGDSFQKDLGSDLLYLGLTWKVEARRVNDTQVELLVGRLLKAGVGGARDLVSIADVGFGVSQTLPVVVALLTAMPGQMVYIEQPEIHLHPRAQHAMAKLLAQAANRGVQVIAETHSSVLLLGIQSLVAEGYLDPAKVKLHWFERNSKTGNTESTSSDLDDAGSFGDWPEDFDDVTLNAQKQYLDAAEKKLAHG